MKALAALDAYGVAYEEKNIADESIANELVEKGGKRQVPYLIDGDVAMYESDDIAAYIEKTYGGGDLEKSVPRVHIAGGHCDTGTVEGKGGCSF